jgi:hypothetical protein
MGKVVLFAIPKVEPKRPWRPTEDAIKRYGRDLAQRLSFDISCQIDNRVREQVAVLASVLGLSHLTELCVDCALAEIIKLCERVDVNAVLDAYANHKSALRLGSAREAQQQ